MNIEIVALNHEEDLQIKINDNDHDNLNEMFNLIFKQP